MHNKEARYDESEARYIEMQGRFDAGESVFLARELTHIRAQVLTVKKAPLNAFSVFPVQTDVPSGAETAIQRIYDSVGMAEIISNYASDLKRADILAKENSVKVFSLGDSYGYNYKEIKNAQYAGKNLDALRAQAAKRGIDLKLNTIAWKGDNKHNIIGFLNNSNITTYTLPADGTGNVTNINKKTETQIIRDFNNFLQSIPTATNEVEQANTVLLPPAVYAHLATTRLSDSDRTLLDFLKQVHPEITRWMKVGELKGAGASGADMMVAGYFDPMYIKFEIPTRFDQLPVQARNLEYVVPCVAEAIGVTVSMPSAFVTATGC